MKEFGLTSVARRKGRPFTQAHEDFRRGAASDTRTSGRPSDPTLSAGNGGDPPVHLRGSWSQLYLEWKDAVLRTVRAGLCPTGCSRRRQRTWRRALNRSQGWRAPARQPADARVSRDGRWGIHKIGECLQAWKPLLNIEKVDDPAEAGARLMADGSVIAWVQGRSEFGPRALGNRSILADPRPAQNKLIINAMIKKREEYRPFAPAVLEESLREISKFLRARVRYLSWSLFCP